MTVPLLTSSSPSGIPLPSNLTALQTAFPNQSQWVGGTMNSGVLSNPLVQAQQAAVQAQAIARQVAIQVQAQQGQSPSGALVKPITIRAPSGAMVTRN